MSWRRPSASTSSAWTSGSSRPSKSEGTVPERSCRTSSSWRPSPPTSPIWWRPQRLSRIPPASSSRQVADDPEMELTPRALDRALVRYKVGPSPWVSSGIGSCTSRPFLGQIQAAPGRSAREPPSEPDPERTAGQPRPVAEGIEVPIARQDSLADGHPGGREGHRPGSLGSSTSLPWKGKASRRPPTGSSGRSWSRSFSRGGTSSPSRPWRSSSRNSTGPGSSNRESDGPSKSWMTDPGVRSGRHRRSPVPRWIPLQPDTAGGQG